MHAVDASLRADAAPKCPRHRPSNVEDVLPREDDLAVRSDDPRSREGDPHSREENLPLVEDDRGLE
jgi:hypothetical protein